MDKTKKQLKAEGFPQWFIDSEKTNYSAEMIDGVVVWRDGVWNDGVRHGGEWHGGEWLGGEWHGGEWLGGEWRGGVWLGGEWHGGAQSFRTKWNTLLLPSGNVKIGCKEMSIAEWIAWFGGTEEFSTPRNSPEFLLIKKAFYAMKAYAETN